jgi:hypothetical protein
MCRLASLLAVLAACGRGSPPGDDRRERPSVPAIAASVDDRCDPAEPRQCIGNDVVACEPDGTLGRRLQACHEGCEDGTCVATCADDGVKLIYVVDSDNDLLRFDPRKLPRDPFERVGKLACGDPGGGPFSMSIDRHGVAWIVYSDGALFKASITDATCRRAPYVPGIGGFRRFGMGFVTDAPGGTTEKLYLASDDESHALGTLDTAHDLTPRAVGTLTASGEVNAELTGTSEAQLFGFYPDRAGRSFVQEINRATGAPRGPRWMLGKTSLGDVTAYAFAQYAGVFYIFVTTTDDNFEMNSTVRAIDRATGAYRVVRDHLPYRITGAGVSTCAPERDQ